MTNNNHPITPPPELVNQWLRKERPPTELAHTFIATQAARWGADQELEAILAFAKDPGISDEDCYFDGFTIAGIRENRRPKPPSLKEQALAELNLTADPDGAELSRTQVELIRRALEQLDE